MRIAVYHNLLSGGAKRALFEYVRRLSANHTIDVYTLSTANHDFADLRGFAQRYEVTPFLPGRLFASPFGRINQLVRYDDLRRIDLVQKSIAMQIDKQGYDVVFANPCQVENSPSILRHLRRTPAVFYCQEPLRIAYEQMPERPYDRRQSRLQSGLNHIDPLPGLYRRALKTRDAANLRYASLVLVNSNFIRQAAERIYGVQARVSRLGVDAGLFRPLGLEKQNFYLSVGSLTPLKGFDFLIRSLALLPEKQRYPLVIVSNFQNPPERDYLLDLAQRVRVHLTLLSDIDDPSLVLRYNQALLTLYAPLREPFGFVTIESMACSTPVVAVQDGGILESVPNGQAGLLTERSESAFAGAVQQMVERPDVRAEFGAFGREHVLKHWTWDTAVQCLEEHFQAAVQNYQA